jgi:hypothetical protein
MGKNKEVNPVDAHRKALKKKVRALTRKSAQKTAR